MGKAFKSQTLEQNPMKGKKGTLKPLLSYCPILTTCCYCIPIKTSIYIIAITGMLSILLFLPWATPAGRRFLTDKGLPKSDAFIVSTGYGLLSLAIFTAHVVLLTGHLIKAPKLLIVYMGFLAVYIFLILAFAAIVAFEAIRAGKTSFGISYFIISILYVVLLIYLGMVVHSQLYEVKAESNVINIHIMIV